jgi:uncharacterized membrane protein
MWSYFGLGKGQRSGLSTRRPGPARKRPTFPLQIEALEDRIVPSGSYIFTTIDDPNAVGYTAASGINVGGDIVGAYYDARSTEHGFLLSGGKYTTINEPNAGPLGTFTTGINARGDIVGSYNDRKGNQHGFLLSSGKYTTIDDPHAVGLTSAQGIDAQGQIVGQYFDASSVRHGFLLSGGQYTTIDDPNAANQTYVNGINARGEIVGTYLSAKGSYNGFLFNLGEYTTIDDPNANAKFGTTGTFAVGINDPGQIVGGFYAGANDVEYGFVFSGGKYITISDPNAGTGGQQGTQADGINDFGQIVGGYIDARGNIHGYLATAGHGDLAPALSDLTMRQAIGSVYEILPAGAPSIVRLTINQVLYVDSGSDVSGSGGLSRIPSGKTRSVIPVATLLQGNSESAGDDFLALHDAVFRDGL